MLTRPCRRAVRMAYPGHRGRAWGRSSSLFPLESSKAQRGCGHSLRRLTDHLCVYLLQMVLREDQAHRGGEKAATTRERPRSIPHPRLGEPPE